MQNATRRIAVSESLRRELVKPTSGTGGYQALVRDIQARLEGDELAVDDMLVERITHYAFDYGSGGWQQLLRDLLKEIETSAPRQ